MRDSILGAVLIGVAAYIATGWLLCRILGVCELEIRDEFNFEKLKAKDNEDK